MSLRRFALGLALLALPNFAYADDLTGTLKKIKEVKSITIGYRETSIPFSYLDENNKPVGFAMDICARVVDAVKKAVGDQAIEVKYTAVTSATRIPLISNGSIDLECGSTTNNEERAKQVSFTNAHFLSESKYVTKKSSNIKSIIDLKGKTVFGTAGTTNIKQLNERNTAENLGLTITQSKDHAEGFLAVETDRAVAFTLDDVLLAGLVANSKNPDLYIVSSDAFSKAEPYSIMFRKDDPAFKKVVDDATASVFQSEGPALYKKWFESAIPPKSINLKLPLSAALKKQFEKPIDSSDPAAYQR
jgi:glutamate/aspartate transport system substrate-binding protein